MEQKLDLKFKKKRTSQEAFLVDGYVKIKCPKDEFFLMDYEDIDLYIQSSWVIHRYENHKYAQGRYSKEKNLHRLIMNAKKGEHVDHINGDTLDNRKQNLRICTRSQNQQNRRKQRNPSSSKYKGVQIHKNRRKDGSLKVYGTIRKDHKIVCKLFRTEIEAARWYNKKAVELFGEFAKLNEIPNE